MTRYRVKVRGEKYLWGSEGVNFNMDWPLLLTVRVDEFGEPITFGTEATNAGSRLTLGTLQPGEVMTIPLAKLRGVFARCDLDTYVYCTLVIPFLAPQP